MGLLDLKNCPIQYSSLSSHQWKALMSCPGGKFGLRKRCDRGLISEMMCGFCLSESKMRRSGTGRGLGLEDGVWGDTKGENPAYSVEQPGAPSVPSRVFPHRNKLWKAGLVWRLGSICGGGGGPARLVYGSSTKFVVLSYNLLGPK